MNCPARPQNSRSEGAAEFLSLKPPHSAAPELKRSPAARALARKPSRKIFFLLEEKIGGAHKIKNVKKIFLRGRPPLCGGWRRGGTNLPFFRNSW